MEIYAGFYEAVFEMTIKTVLINEKKECYMKKII